MIAADAGAALVQDHLQGQGDAGSWPAHRPRARVPQRGMQRRELVVVRLDGLWS